MKIPTWTKPAVTGAVVGAIATMVIGFTEGGWHSAGSTARIAKAQSAAAVIDALVPVCVSQAKLDPEESAKMKELTKMASSYGQRDYVMKAGWATVPAATEPDADLATACAEVLLKQGQS
jgi:hypothetical protein